MAATDTDTLELEHAALRDGCGLLDRSERGKLALSGPDAVEFLGGQVTNELSTLRPGEGCYAAFLTHKGKMLGDLRILAVGDDGEDVDDKDDRDDKDDADSGDGHEHAAPTELLLDTERVALQALFDMIRRFKVGYDMELHKRTLERGLLSLIGPLSEQVAGTGALGPQEHSNAPVRVEGVATLAVRTDVGVDLICEARDTEGLAAALRERGAVAVSDTAAECLRIERGRPRYGIDLDDSVIPQEAGLNERAVSFTKGCYVGQETVARLHYKGKPNRHLRGVRLSEPARAGEELLLGERSVGRLSSVAVSPRLGAIALGLVRREAAPGTTVQVGTDGASAEVLELPFPPG